MRRLVGAAAVAGLVAGCIPQADPPPGYPGGPPAGRYRAAPERPPPAVDDRPPAENGYQTAPAFDRPPPEADPQLPVEDRPPPPRHAAYPRARPAPPPPPAARPAWEARPAAADAVAVAASTYVVRPGDTLGGIADATGAAAQAIARANDLQPPFTVHAGQRLAIPAGRYHLVRPGQSGIAIARAYGIEWSRIVAANDLQEPFILRAGQRILIPGPATGSTSLAERARAFSLDIDDILTGGEPALAASDAPARPVSRPTRALPPMEVVAAPPRPLRGGFLRPVSGTVVKRFGPGASGERNDGIEIAVPLATPVHAVADGVVAYVGDGIAALGGLVIVKHGGGWTSVYGRASKLLVTRGQAVKRGQVIALSGDTGYADRPELHFELRRGRVPVDPQAQLPAT